MLGHVENPKPGPTRKVFLSSLKKKKVTGFPPKKKKKKKLPYNFDVVLVLTGIELF